MNLPTPAVALVLGIFSTLAADCGSADDETASQAESALGEAASVTESHLDSITALGEADYWEGEFETARSTWQAALERARASRDPRAEAGILTWLGLAAYRLGEYDEARQLGEAALSIKLDLGLREDLSKSYNALGLLAWSQGRLADAADLLDSASTAAQAVGDEEGVAKATHNLGLVYVELGEFDRAREAFEHSQLAGRSIGHVRLEGASVNNLGMLAIKVGDPVAGIALLQEARQLYRSIDYTTGEQNTLGQLATAYAALGQPALAFAVLDTAQTMAEGQGLQQEVASNLELLGDLYRGAGDLRRALENYAQARSLNEELELEIEKGSNLRSEADIYAAFDELEKARDLAVEALEIHQVVGAQLEAGWDLLLLAELSHRLGHVEQANQHILQARRLAAELASRPLRVSVAITEARLADLSRDFQAARRSLTSIDSDLELSGYREQWEAEQLRARAYAGLGNPDSAAAAGRRAVHAVERVRRNYGSPVLRTAFVADQSSTYTELVETLLRLGAVNEAFEVADAVRGRALLEHLVALGRGSRWNGGTIRAMAEGEELLREIEALVERLNEIEEIPPEERLPADEETKAYLTAKLVDVRDEYETLTSSLAARHPDAVSMLGGRSVRAQQVRFALAPGEVLIEYLVTPQALLLFAIRREGIQSLDYAIPHADLESRVRLVRDLISSKSIAAEELQTMLEGLHEILIGPLIRSGVLREADRVIVVPHAVLNYLPFGALRDPVTGKYLVEEYALVTLPSAAALSLLRTDERKVAAGDGQPPVVFTPFPRRLPASVQEAKAIKRTLPETRVRRGKDASEVSLLEALENNGIVHVATHGVLNRYNPMFSRIEMASNADSGQDDDGWLEVHELITSRLQSRLVFLSGCETGVGQAWSTSFAPGEDYATLAKAFLYAGARNVIATLWRVEDEGAAVFAARFYHHLGPLGPAESLVAAQRDMIRDDQYAEPFYWAAYQLNGMGYDDPSAKWAAVSVRQN